MDNSYNNNPPYTVNLPTSNRVAISNPAVNMPIDLNKGSSKDIPNPFIIPGLKKIKVNSQLNENYSFENFIEGDCNRLARSAGYAFASNPGKTVKKKSITKKIAEYWGINEQNVLLANGSVELIYLIITAFG